MIAGNVLCNFTLQSLMFSKRCADVPCDGHKAICARECVTVFGM